MVSDIIRWPDSWPRLSPLASVLAFLLLLVAGCQDVPVDRLYALHLDQEPSISDWDTALPREVVVRGGSKNVPPRLGDIDNDTVHTSTASCHHGAALPDPVHVDMRAFYTNQFLFLRISWLDPTRDDTIRQWQFNGEEWQAGENSEDGFGLMWDTRGSFSQFTCSYACHIDDFGVSGANFHARNRMRLNQSKALVDLWNWKASRTGIHGFVDDRYLDEEGMRPDVPGEIFHPNSRRAASAGLEPFLEGDQPLYDSGKKRIDATFHLAGSVAPGYIIDRPAAGRADISALSQYADGRWTVILKRALDTGDSKDIIFLPGDEAGVSFGLSIMDNTLDQHYASATTEKIILMARNNELAE